jgi:hypothetical protein
MASTVAGTSLAVPSSQRSNFRIQISIALMLALGIASFFWLDSRYPALLKKLHSGTAIKTSGVLSFDAKLPVAPPMPLATRIERTTINWMWTNRVGMTFSLFFGAAVLTLLPLLPRRRFRSPAANTALGAITGVPLGVCANCVAPIGQSLYEGGASSTTVLATMISSPMLNVVVLTMVFALFPPGVALLRVAVPLVLLAMVPWLVGQTKPVEVQCQVPSAGWLVPATGTVKQYLKNLARLAATTIPFMILAALLGAIVAELIPSHAREFSGYRARRPRRSISSGTDGIRCRRRFHSDDARRADALCRHFALHTGSVQCLSDADRRTNDVMENIRPGVCGGYGAGHCRWTRDGTHVGFQPTVNEAASLMKLQRLQSPSLRNLQRIAQRRQRLAPQVSAG